MSFPSATPGQPLPPDTSGGGNTVFVYGILGAMLCQLLAPVAWIKGNEYIRTCAMMGVAPSGLGIAGRWIGIIATMLNVIGIVGAVIMWSTR